MAEVRNLAQRVALSCRHHPWFSQSALAEEENYGAVLNCGRETSKAGGVTEAGSLRPEVAAEAYDGIEFVQFWLTETDL
ncbi:hypothetical protein KC19_2G270900 [Ceratodon purpureus]|uniref:Uncharacterized protein n=1 Tax=Ceratodon purpureus TaxID=3225 RepID=A0A8T0J0U3_CERPU|nr:hypothetical protein KC19_2G270900 [Ceratodon purpureus]